jgi:phosphoserine phosphatase
LRTQLLFVDLDGTIIASNINNTFDFLRSYLYNYGIPGIIRYRLARLVSGVLFRFLKNDIVSRRFYLLISVFGMKKEELCGYAIEYWLKLIKNYLNKEVLYLLQKLRDKGYKPVLLTSCIEIPACLIAKFLGFEECIATTFRCLGDLIVGIAKDTHACLKLRIAVKRYGADAVKHATYIVDSQSASAEHPYEFIDNIYIIDKARATAF